MLRFSIILFASFTSFHLFALTPLAWESIPDAELSVGDSVSVPLDDYLAFYDPDAPRVRVATVVGDMDILLRPDRAPKTVANFLSYVDNAEYKDSFFHRSVPGFVIQTGGFKVEEAEEGPQIAQIDTGDPVENEFNVSNTRGTIAMAKLQTDPNSATSQWFVNLSDNGDTLDGQNGGFTVFGEVINEGMQVADAIAALPRVNLGGALEELPLFDYDGNSQPQFNNLVLVSRVSRLPEAASDFPADELPGLTLVSNSSESVIRARMDGRALALMALSTGDATLTVRAEGDNDNESLEVSFKVNVVAGGSSTPGIFDVFTEAVEAGEGWWFTGWYGFGNDTNWPWLFTLEHGWQYFVPAGADSAWLYDSSEGMGWLWIGKGIYPYIYHTADEEFILYATEIEEDGWYYFPGIDTWRQIL